MAGSLGTKALLDWKGVSVFQHVFHSAARGFFLTWGGCWDTPPVPITGSCEKTGDSGTSRVAITTAERYLHRLTARQ